LSRRVAVNQNELDRKINETISPHARHAVTRSLEQVLYINMMNYKEYTLTICRENLFAWQYGIYFQKNHYLVKSFNKYISQFKASGLIDFWASDYINNKYLNMKLTESGPKMLNVEQLLGSFEVLFIGLLLGTLIFACELIAQILHLMTLQRVFEFFQ
jgi:hypothetical protein